MNKAIFLLLSVLLTGCIVYQPRPTSDFGYTYDTALPLMDTPPAPAVGLTHTPAVARPVTFAETIAAPPQTPPIYSELPTPEPVATGQQPVLIQQPQQQILLESAGAQPIIQESQPIIQVPSETQGGFVPFVTAAPGFVVTDGVDAAVVPGVIAEDSTRDLHNVDRSDVANNIAGTNRSDFTSAPAFPNEPAGAQRTNSPAIRNDQAFNTNAPVIRDNQRFGTNSPVIRSNQFFNSSPNNTTTPTTPTPTSPRSMRTTNSPSATSASAQGQIRAPQSVAPTTLTPRSPNSAVNSEASATAQSTPGFHGLTNAPPPPSRKFEVPTNAVSSSASQSSANEPAGAANTTTFQSNQSFNFSPQTRPQNPQSQPPQNFPQPQQQQDSQQQFQQQQQQQQQQQLQEQSQNPSAQPPSNSGQEQQATSAPRPRPAPRQLHNAQPAPAAVPRP